MIKFSQKLLKPYTVSILAVGFLQLLQALLTLILPRINSGIIDVGIVNRDVPYITKLMIIMILLSVLQFACAMAGSTKGAAIALGAGRDLRSRVYRKILGFSGREAGEFGAPVLITRATNDVQQIITFFTFFFTSMVSAPLMFIGGLVLAISQDLRLSTVLVVTIPLLVIISAVFLISVLPYYRKQQTRMDELTTVVNDEIFGVRVVKAFSREDFEKEKMTRIASELSAINTTIAQKTAMLQPLFTVLVNISSIVLLWIGGTYASEGDFRIGDVIAFITYVSMILTATLTASLVFLMLPRAEVSAQRIQEIFDTNSSVTEPADPVPMPEAGSGAGIEFRNVEFSYAGDDPDVACVLKDISFCMKPGTTTAVIGSTGAGKSTLMSLVNRTMDPTKGSITYGGKDIREYPLKELRSRIGYVPQKAFLFSGTLRKNLLSGKSDATDEELWEALDVAQARQFIEESDGKLDMTVAETGSNYSGGQRQRLCIARALVRRPQICLFDDSFSALDYSTDLKLRRELKKITGDSIVMIVGQRISSIMDADQIIVLNNGRIEDIGKHEELLTRSRTYQEIASSQLKEEGA